MSRIALKICVEDSRLTFKESFESSATVATLLDCIFSKSGRNSVLLYCGFPPTEIAFSSPHDTLFDVGICSGSVVIVRDRPVVVKRSVAADNSCLFHALSYAVTKDRNQNSTQYREVVSDIISCDTDKYSEAFLGRPNAEYCTWIRQGTSWGGEIELGILAEYLRLDIAVADVQTNNVYVYSPLITSGSRVFLLYDGIHYDALAYAKFEAAPEGADVTIFSTNDKTALEGVKAKAEQLRTDRQFVDLKSFSVICLVCDQGFHGHEEAAAHAKLTSHQNFLQN